MRLIDADELKDQIIDEIGIIPTADMKDTVPSAISFVNRLNMAPTIDAVPVVRCRECRRWERLEFSLINFCPEIHEFTDAEFFCKRGKRREEEHNATD